LQSNILCLETSAAKCSVAVTYGIDKTLYLESIEDFSHVSQITRMIQQLLDDAGLAFNALDAVAISGGPGSYTGLRVGASTAKGICFGMDIPLIAVDTLTAIAQTIKTQSAESNNTLYVSVIDARRDEVYMAGYDHKMKQILPPQAHILTSESFKEHLENYDKISIGGDAAKKAGQILSNPKFSFNEISPNASHLIPMAREAHSNAEYVEISAYKPYYLKPPNITVSKKQFFRKN